MRVGRERGFVVVTGASRGTGAEVAIALAHAGYDIGIGYREKSARALRVAAQIAEIGRRSLLLEGDISTPAGRAKVVAGAAAVYPRFAGLVLNASGGLEAGKGPEYPMRINCEAQVGLLRLCLPYLGGGGRVVYVTSHFAHEYPDLELLVPGYEPVAVSKNAGEQALLGMNRELVALGIRLVIATGDVLADSSMVALLERANPGLTGRRRAVVGKLPTTREFAATVARGIIAQDLVPGEVLA